MRCASRRTSCDRRGCWLPDGPFRRPARFETLRYLLTVTEQPREILATHQGRRDELNPILQRLRGRDGYLFDEATAASACSARAPEVSVYAVAPSCAPSRSTSIDKEGCAPDIPKAAE